MSENTDRYYYPADEDWFARHWDAMEKVKAALDLDPNPWVSDPSDKVKP
jgi:hypothetical protein